MQKNPANSVLGGLPKRRPKKNLPARKVVNTGSKIDLSVVVPIYNEEDNISDLVERIVEKLKALQRTYEVLLVDDGSTDNSALRVRDQASLYEQVRGIYLARNYGQSTAMQAGFDEAKGAFICTLDGDLQNDPADIPMMLERLEATGADLISGWRAKRQDGAIRKFFSRTANALISRATGVGLHDYGCSLKIYRRRTLERIRLYGELHRFLPALIAEVGGRAIEVKVRHHPRTRGKSKYKLDRTVRVILDLLLISFLRRYMQRPIHLFGSVGLLLGGIGLIILVYLVALKLLLHASIGGRPLLLLGVMSVILGVMMVGQGLIGEVTSRTFFAARGHRQYHLLEEEDVCARGKRAD